MTNAAREKKRVISKLTQLEDRLTKTWHELDALRDRADSLMKPCDGAASSIDDAIEFLQEAL